MAASYVLCLLCLLLVSRGHIEWLSSVFYVCLSWRFWTISKLHWASTPSLKWCMTLMKYKSSLINTKCSWNLAMRDSFIYYSKTLSLKILCWIFYLYLYLPYRDTFKNQKVAIPQGLHYCHHSGEMAGGENGQGGKGEEETTPIPTKLL